MFNIPRVSLNGREQRLQTMVQTLYKSPEDVNEYTVPLFQDSLQ